VLFAGLLGHWGQKGPAEVEPKRQWTFRHIAWLSHTLQIPIDTPASHPFNPLPLLRLALACAQPGDVPNRRVVEALMRHVWRGGADASDPQRLRALAEALAPQRDPGGDDVKKELRALSDEALARGVFGVPTFDVDGRLFWGIDALPMVRAALQDDAWFRGPQWDAAAVKRPGVTR
jgi:2-hydroxychromene-2-carboxylate isomerase